MNQSDVIDNFNPDYARKHGCAWFVWNDSEHNVSQTGGWASIGGEPAFEFHRAQDLPNDIIWWTNLTKAESWALGKWSHIKHAGFLGPDWLSLMSEWGLPNDIEDLKFYCSSWAEVLARISEFLSRWNQQLSNNTSRINPSWSWGEGDFHEVLAEKLALTCKKDEFHKVLEVAYTDIINQEIPSNFLNGKRKLVLNLPRLSHAKKILASRYPSSDFEEVSIAEWPQDHEKRWSWIENQTLPILIRFDEIRFREDSEKLAALFWGLRGKRFVSANMEPVWLTGEEALEMHQWIESVPVVALRAKGWTSLPHPKAWPFDVDGFLHENSVVTGLLFEGLWKAHATPVRTPTKRIKSGVCPRIIWLRAADRRACFSIAKTIIENDTTNSFIVHSYGEGSVTLLFDPEKTLLSDWSTVIKKSNVKLPIIISDCIEVSQEIDSKNVDIWLKQFTVKNKSLEPWLWLDRLLWPWVSPQKQILKPIMEHAVRSLASIDAPNNTWATKWKEELKTQAKKAVQSIAGKK